MGYFKNAIKKILSLIWGFLKWVVSTSSIIFSFILVFIILMVLIIAIYNEYGYYKYNKFRKAKPFDAATWQKTNPQEKSYEDKKYTRCYMYRDLVKNKLHFNMSYDSVIKLLGKVEGESYYINPLLKSITYNVGECTMRFDYEATDVVGYSLHLFFDRNLRLVAFGHDEDLREKDVSYKNRKYLFSCDNKEVCSRYEKKSGGFLDWEECKKSEVESKWGYKAW